MHQVQSQQSYQVHSQQQGYQAKPQPVSYQPQQAPPSGQHGYHPQQQQQQAGQYPTAHGHQGQQHDQMPHRQQTMTTQQFHQQQGNQNQGRQVPYDSGHHSQQMPPPPQQQQQQQQQQKPEQRQGAGLGYSQHYTVYTFLKLCLILMGLGHQIKQTAKIKQVFLYEPERESFLDTETVSSSQQ